jgi:selenocysteine lyase/cysteine desulfurase
MAGALRQRLAALRGVRLLDLEPGRGSGLVTFQLLRRPAGAAWQALTQRGFRLDTCQVRGTLLARRLPDVDSALRVSVHYYTTEAELDTFCRALTELNQEGE